MESIVVMKLICLFLFLWFNPLLIIMMIRGQPVHMLNFVIPAAAATGFIYLQWLI